MFLETPRFPLPPSLSYRVRPRYSVTATERAGGHERRNLNWSAPLHNFACEIEHAESDISEVLEFYHAVAGTAYMFRFKDWNDYKSCRGHLSVAATDQPLQLMGGSPAAYQMIKLYTKGALTRTRPIQKPVSGTLLVADNGVIKTLGTHYTVDYTMGIVTLLFAPVGALTWGGEFDVPVRFAEEVDFEWTFRGDDGTHVQRVPFTLSERRV